MNPIEFVKTLYFGDRGLTKILLNLCKEEVELHIDCISRIRDKTGEWKYYNDEDIEDAIIVIHGVEKIIFDESGLLPNDFIYNFHASEMDEGIYKFTMEAGGFDKDENITLEFSIVGKGIYLIDPKQPDNIITT